MISYKTKACRPSVCLATAVLMLLGQGFYMGENIALAFSPVGIPMMPRQRYQSTDLTTPFSTSHKCFRAKTLSVSLSSTAAVSIITSVSSEDLTLAFWVVAFSTSHIGMSAVRTKIIAALGVSADTAGLVGNTAWQLPDIWPGDDVGQQQLFPDPETTGRQLYRALYTAVSFLTLGGAFGAYLAATDEAGILSSPSLLPWNDETLFLANGIASLCFGISIASLFNPSPLSLVPGFVLPTESDTTPGNSDNKSKQKKTSLPLGVERIDSLKLEPRGMTRITRHPLILPVAPWGIATAILAGGRLSDLILFGGLAIYAIAGCAAQDLRIQKEEGSVGTVFAPDNASSTAGTNLQGFFETTSFVPFAAILDGRQSWKEAVEEFPLLAFVGGCVVGHALEDVVVDLLL